MTLLEGLSLLHVNRALIFEFDTPYKTSDWVFCLIDRCRGGRVLPVLDALHGGHVPECVH